VSIEDSRVCFLKKERCFERIRGFKGGRVYSINLGNLGILAQFRHFTREVERVLTSLIKFLENKSLNP